MKSFVGVGTRKLPFQIEGLFLPFISSFLSIISRILSSSYKIFIFYHIVVNNSMLLRLKVETNGITLLSDVCLILLRTVLSIFMASCSPDSIISGGNLF